MRTTYILQRMRNGPTCQIFIDGHYSFIFNLAFVDVESKEQTFRKLYKMRNISDNINTEFS